MKYVVWTLFVWVPAILITSVAHAVDAVAGCSNPNGCFVPPIGDIALVLIVVPAVPPWVVGLLVMWWRDMSRRSRWQP
jgi:hypothetical protein